MEIKGTTRRGQDIGLPPIHEMQGGAVSSLPEEPASDQPEYAASPISQFMDPLMKSLVQAQLDRGAPTVPLLRDGRSVLYTKDDMSGAGSAAPAKVSVPADVASMLTEGAKIPEAKAEFTGAQKAIAAGDYAKAYGYLESLMRKQGEEVLSEDAVKAAQTVRDQLEILAKMQKAGIKPDYPPTEAQLVDYFKTFKDNPVAARQAFYDYAQQFHVHPGTLSQGDIVYSKDGNKYSTHVPDSWSEIANRPAKDKSRHIGKQMNDCEGYAFIAEKLLVASGFKVAHHVTAFPGPENSGHSMVTFTHPKEKGFTVTSNHYVFKENAEKAAAEAGLKSVQGGVVGKVEYYTGKTMADSQTQMVIKDKKL